MDLRLVALSDLHGLLPAELPPADVVILSGDIAPDFIQQPYGWWKNSTPRTARDVSNPLGQIEWMRITLRPWLKALERRGTAVIATPGNHDFWGESAYRPLVEDLELPWSLLIDEGATFGGLTFWGSPWQLPCGDWAFNGFENTIRAAMDLIPPGIDVLVLHGPAKGYGDHVGGAGHVGSRAALDAIDRVKPRLATAGHIHEAKGEWMRGDTKIVNVSILDDNYKVAYPAWQGTLAQRQAVAA